MTTKTAETIIIATFLIGTAGIIYGLITWPRTSNQQMYCITDDQGAKLCGPLDPDLVKQWSKR